MHRRPNAGGSCVAVGTAVARRPPRRSVRAGLLHTAPTLDEWRQSARSGADARYGRWEASAGPDEETEARSSDGVGSVAGGRGTSAEEPRSEERRVGKE